MRIQGTAAACAFITAATVPITKLFAWGEGDTAVVRRQIFLFFTEERNRTSRFVTKSETLTFTFRSRDDLK